MNATPEWIKSSYSDQLGGNCVEWAPALASAGDVPVRDSKDVSRAPLSFSTDVWMSFVQGLRQGSTFGA